MILLMGYPASGKSTIAKLKEEHEGCVILNRDSAGGKVVDLLPRLSALLKAGKKVLLDNTFPTAESREPFIKMADNYGEDIICLWLKTSIEDAQVNACLRMVRKYGRLIPNAEMKTLKDPNCYPPVVLFKYRKQFEKPMLDEGFESISTLPFVRKWPMGYSNRAILFDYDGTLRKTHSGAKWPTEPEDVRILLGRESMAESEPFWKAKLLGVSNQSAIAKGSLTTDQATACFDKTNELLGVNIEYEFCPHGVPPNCWCRKPMPGLGVLFIEKYKLNPDECTMVGDMTSDKTFATRCGFQYEDAEEFFQET